MTEKVQILFYPGGGLGDAIVSMPVLSAVSEFFSDNAELDVFSTQNLEALQEIYHGFSFINQILPSPPGAEFILKESYDLVIVANELVNFEIKQKAQFAMPEFVKYAERGLKNRERFVAASHVGNLLNNQLGNHAVLLGLDRRTLPLFSLGMPSLQKSRPLLQIQPGALLFLEKHGLSHGEFITVQDGWDANFFQGNPKERPTKVWQANAWAKLVENIRLRHPNKKIVQLGSSKTGEDIPGVDLNLRGKTPLKDALALLKYAALHVDTEGGMVHMAHGLNTRSLVLFGPTNEKFFGYPDNKNLVPPCNNCWWLTSEWMNECVRDLEVPECMSFHKPTEVAAQVTECLTENQGIFLQAAYEQVPALHTSSTIMVVNDAARAGLLANEGHEVTHADPHRQKNVQKPVTDLNYEQYLARPTNLPAKNYSVEVLYFTAHGNQDEFAAELIEAARILKSGGHAVVQTEGQDVSAAFKRAGFQPPKGTGTTLLLRPA